MNNLSYTECKSTQNGTVKIDSVPLRGFLVQNRVYTPGRIFSQKLECSKFIKL